MVCAALRTLSLFDLIHSIRDSFQNDKLQKAPFYTEMLLSALCSPTSFNLNCSNRSPIYQTGAFWYFTDALEVHFPVCVQYKQIQLHSDQLWKHQPALKATSFSLQPALKAPTCSVPPGWVHLDGEETVIFYFLPPTSIWVYSTKTDFAPTGARSIL